MGKGSSNPAAFAMFTRDARNTPAYASLDIDSASTTAKPRVLLVLGSIMDRIVTSNEAAAAATAAPSAPGAAASDEPLTVFHGLRSPGISIDAYLDRVFKYAHCSPSVYALAYVYIDRMMQRKDAMLITELNVHRLLITSVLVAAKFLDDQYFNNAYYAKVGGISIAEMNRLEMEFLFRLDFRLQVAPEDFARYCELLAAEPAGLPATYAAVPPIPAVVCAAPTRAASLAPSRKSSSAIPPSVASASDSGPVYARAASDVSWNRAAAAAASVSHVISFFSPQNQVGGNTSAALGAAPHSAAPAVSHPQAPGAPEPSAKAQEAAASSDANALEEGRISVVVEQPAAAAAAQEESRERWVQANMAHHAVMVGS